MRPGQGETGATQRAASEGDLAGMSSHHASDDGQPQTMTACVAIPTRIQANEGLEDLSILRRVYTGAIVFDAQTGLPGFRSHADEDLSLGITQCIANQIIESSGQQERVSLPDQWGEGELQLNS